MRFGIFRLSACMVVQRRGRPLEGSYSVGLLARAPTPEGLGGEEVSADGYARQRVHFGPPAEFSETVSSGDRVSFGVIPDLAARLEHGGLFDHDGNLVAYGRISIAPGQIASDEVAFEPGSISVRF